MIKTILIDDELSIRKALREKLNTYFKDEILVIGEAGSVADGVSLIDTLKPDLLLLDIELEDGTSFELLEKLNHENFLAIFITGFNNHAIRAIKVGALDYLVKPIADAEFQEAIQHVISKKDSESIAKEQFNVSNDFFKGIKNKRLVLKTFDTHFIIYEADIMYCQSEGNYTTYFMVNNSKIVVSKSMKKVEELLSKDFFVKCHQSYLVNLNYVAQYKVDGYLILQGNVKIPIATRRKDFVLQKIENFQ